MRRVSRYRGRVLACCVAAALALGGCSASGPDASDPATQGSKAPAEPPTPSGSAALAEAGVAVWGVEVDKEAVSHARRNVREARFSSGKVERVLAKLPRRTDLVVLDPPRTGAGRRVLQQVLRRGPRAVAYVACDPAALGRDLAYAADLGYAPVRIRAFDLFPRTHHVECVAILEPLPR